MYELLKTSSDPMLSRQLLTKVKQLSNRYTAQYKRLPVIMEVCGSHTMALAKSGVKQALSDHVKLISGPGCPVCVTAQEEIDSMIQLSLEKEVILCTFGDMMRVPGSTITLMEAKAEGRDVRVVYSPLDAVKLAIDHPTKQVVFLGVGFETTIPIISVAIDLAEQHDVENFSVWLSTKLVEPILRTLLEEGDTAIDAFLLPGHVAMVTGSEHFDFLPKDFGVTGSITGFEPVELLSGIYECLLSLLENDKSIKNCYKAVVSREGNRNAIRLMEQYFRLSDENWRGLGIINNSGLRLKEEYNQFNARERFQIQTKEPPKTKCRCGEVISGKISPSECILFGKGCTPIKPIGPCMVSTEGSCSASYQYLQEVEA
ncbi:hydrogenase formation protein HypD [Bacillus solimangrovi]|uniref:Hydrogenase formation protein HypD n=1 Tax=Bacillus solimangrovi TaxID=1305675 RepID=A0A1E5LFE0_9BACI|nr:hydrogenase formation protein HypD [Bacillus solimangrovi]OEH92808.1 hydrogenase formation protein HypD [Bacillus solimangrovi]